MARAWQALRFGPDWLGFYNRDQPIPADPRYAERARNVEFVGSSVAKRRGTLAVNSSATVGGRTIAPIDGLFHAVFRDGSEFLFAHNGTEALEARLVVILASSSIVATAYPATTVDVTWGSTTTGTLTSVQGLRVGDTIWIQNGVGGTRYHGTVASIVASTRTITLTSPAATTPTAADPVIFQKILEQPSVGFDPAFPMTHFVQYANATHVVSGFFDWALGQVIDSAVGPRKVVLISGTPTAQHHGIGPPATAPTVADAGAGAGPNGTYQYRVTFRNSVSGQESEGGPASSQVSVTDNDIALTNIPVSVDPQVDKKRIYRTLAGGAVYFFVDEINNATTTYTDSDADTELGRPLREFLDTPLPETASFISLWPQANRLIAINGRSVIYSDQPDLDEGFLKGESWPPDNEIFVGYDDGDPPVAVAAFFDSVLVLKRRSVWRVRGIPPDIVIEPVSFRTDRTGIGCAAPRSLAVDENELVFAAEDGIYRLSRYEGVQQGFESQRLSFAIDAYIRGVVAGDGVTLGWPFASGVYFRRRRQYRLFGQIEDPDLSTTPSTTPDANVALVFQFDTETGEGAHGWSVWDTNGGQVHYTVAAVASRIPDRVYVAQANGIVVEMDQGADDHGDIAIGFEYRTVFFYPAGQGQPCRGRAVDILFDALTGSPTLTVGVRTKVTGSAPPTVPVPAAGGLFRRLLFLARGQAHKIVITEGGNDTGFEIDRMAYWFQPLPAEAAEVSGVQPGIEYESSSG